MPQGSGPGPDTHPIADHAGAPLIARADGVVRITLNRPAEHNRLDPADVDALNALLPTLAADPQVRALLITGTGDKTFSSGYTLQAIASELDARFERMLDTLEHLPIPTIALFNGSVYGGATDLALCCDFRIGYDGMRMFMPAARFGLHYYPGGLRRYVSRLGLNAAKKLFLTAMTIDSDEMLRIGFLTDRVARDRLDACACDHRGRAGLGDRPYPQRGHLLAALAAVRGVDAGAIARGLADKARIPEAVHEARVAALEALG